MENPRESDKNSVRSGIVFLIKRAWAYKTHVSLIFLFLVLSAGVTFAQPLIIRQITDRGMVGQDIQFLCLSAGILFLLVLLGAAINIMQNYFFSQMQNKIQISMMSSIFSKMLHLRMDYFSDKNSGEIIHMISNDVSMVNGIAEQSILYVFSSLLTLIGGFIGLLVIDWKLALVVLLIIPIKYALVNFLSQKEQEVTENYIESMRKFYAWFADSINGMREIKLWGLHTSCYETLRKKQHEILMNKLKSSMNGAYNQNLSELTDWLLTCLLYMVGGIFFIRGDMTIGGVIAFVAYKAQVTGPITSVISIRYLLAQLLPSMDRIEVFYKLDEEETNGCLNAKEILFQDLEANCVSFSYDNTAVLDKLSFHISSGEKIAIIGSNGSGKTTLINLLLRFLTPQEGYFTINKTPIDQFDLNSYRSLFAVVNQHSYLFQTSIRHNIDLERVASLEELEHVLSLSGAKTFVEKQENGWEQSVGHNGATISGGERQKIAVARAILKNSPIIILDEATSNYDEGSRAFFRDVLKSSFHDKTVIFVTHHAEDLSGLDRVYKIEANQLIELTQTDP